MSEKVIMSAGDIKRTLARISHEILERNQALEDLVIVGIRTRGVPIARRLARNIENYENIQIPVGSLDISRHRDDLPSNGNKNGINKTNIPVGIENKTVILIDDVLFTGRSIRAAMDALVELGRPKSVQAVVLVDRGHRELPIRADYVGKNIPSARDEEIKVKLSEVDGEDGVVITKLNKELQLNSSDRSGSGEADRLE